MYDDILIARNDKEMIAIKKLLSTNFEMKNMGEANYVIDIKIIRTYLKGF